MNNETNKFFTLDDLKDKYVGKPGSAERENYKYELRMDVLGRVIKTVRLERKLKKPNNLF
ncbi:hypothetical protein L0657_10945 [Dyadobacter sp. CY345]|uniref:hypothetical protein n=1 Tax=Dyadobacter sp. CY345 TaxID=2909335 RepID=UPI001F46A873|nr:hypothetical protein [Dyadobacter sp. CY345]MCF2444473.1 hypothetical protein [Dyadobacter sp. CY345]